MVVDSNVEIVRKSLVVVIVELYMVVHMCEVCKYMGGWPWFAVQICAN